MVIPYRTAKFKSANIILLIAIWGSTAKFNAHQYFRLYGIYFSMFGLVPAGGSAGQLKSIDFECQETISY